MPVNAFEYNSVNDSYAAIKHGKGIGKIKSKSKPKKKIKVNDMKRLVNSKPPSKPGSSLNRTALGGYRPYNNF